ncbi:Mov34/MPN/PAD-1 family protein [Sphingomonas sp. PR090111-T3T-6A]|uniref:Mov34/MPN/PAD-1 family protein n=1 Tax=Sphingomonas sp. PR090111-T3T-6A TaxID=685778 RepID=UPI000567374A|nr:M67 family metallopeptidase [Sphingomonas sp. PR090111-T3T-6A]
MAIRISRALFDCLMAEAALAPMREICGLLFGTDERIEAVEPARNVAVDPARWFEVDPAALFTAIRAERAGGPRLLGHYHSHPSGVAAPSAQDAATAFDAGRLWLILGGGEALVWRAVPGGPVQGAFEPVRLVVD